MSHAPEIIVAATTFIGTLLLVWLTRNKESRWFLFYLIILVAIIFVVATTARVIVPTMTPDAVGDSAMLGALLATIFGLAVIRYQTYRYLRRIIGK